MTTRGLFTLAAAFLAAGSLAQVGEAHPHSLAHSASGTASSGRFDPDKMISFEGRVVGIEISNPGKSSIPNVSLLVRLTNGGTALVELGPKPYVDQQRMHFRLKDRVQVRGSKIFEGSNSAVLASEVNHNGFRVAFRSPEGRPFWLARNR